MTRAGMVVDPGKLTHIVRLEHIRERVPDGAGGYTEVWELLPNGETWAFIRPLSGTERMRSDQARSNATHRGVIRWRADVTALCRVVWGGDVYTITEPPRSIPDHRDTHLEMILRVEPTDG